MWLEQFQILGMNQEKAVDKHVHPIQGPEPRAELTVAPCLLQRMDM